MEIKIKKISEKATLPKVATEFSAGADLCACSETDIKVHAGETVLVHTGLAMEIPVGYAGMIFARSGLATKRGLAPANKVGVVDADYRGEVMVALHNHSSETQIISHGERIAQLVIMPFLAASFVESETLEDTVRGSGGFGSTGK